jgi:hypothetical protein
VVEYGREDAGGEGGEGGGELCRGHGEDVEYGV